MEGMLEKKGGGSTTFGRRNWKKRYFILQATDLVYYDTYDKEKDTPMSMKGSVDVVDASVRKLDAHRDRKYVFEVRPKDGKTILLCTEDEKLLQVWMKAVKQASLGLINPNKYYDLLHIRYDEPITMDRLAHAYLELSKGLSKNIHYEKVKMTQLREACQFLKSNLEEDEIQNTSDTIAFSAIIQKGMTGIGFGMVITEDPNVGQMSIEEVMPVMRLIYLDEMAEGSLERGDILVSINDEDVTTWNLMRVKQRLADFRVPVNSEVMFSFQRRIAKPDSTYCATLTSSSPNMKRFSYGKTLGQEVQDEEEESSKKSGGATLFSIFKSR